MNHYCSPKFKAPNMLTERTTATASMGVRTLQTAQQTERNTTSRQSLIRLFTSNSRRFHVESPRTQAQELFNPKASFKGNAKFASTQFKQYLIDKKLIEQITTRGMRLALRPQLKKQQTLKQTINSMNKGNSPTLENMKLANFLLNTSQAKRSKESTEKEIQIIFDSFPSNLSSPTNDKVFSKHIIQFARNLTTYLIKDKKLPQ